jgi:hypothetical protein
VVAPPPVHLVKRRVEAVNVCAALIDSVAASAVSNDLHRPEVKPHFEVVQNSAAAGGSRAGRQSGRRGRAGIGGHQAADTVGTLSRLRSYLEKEGAGAETLKMVDDRRHEGTGYIEQFKAMLHEGQKPEMPHFSRWFKDANQLIQWFKLTPEEREQAVSEGRVQVE